MAVDEVEASHLLLSVPPSLSPPCCNSKPHQSLLQDPFFFPQQQQQQQQFQYQQQQQHYAPPPPPPPPRRVGCSSNSALCARCRLMHTPLACSSFVLLPPTTPCLHACGAFPSLPHSLPSCNQKKVLLGEEATIMVERIYKDVAEDISKVVCACGCLLFNLCACGGADALSPRARPFSLSFSRPPLCLSLSKTNQQTPCRRKSEAVVPRAPRTLSLCLSLHAHTFSSGGTTQNTPRSPPKALF